MEAQQALVYTLIGGRIAGALWEGGQTRLGKTFWQAIDSSALGGCLIGGDEAYLHATETGPIQRSRSSSACCRMGIHDRTAPAIPATASADHPRGTSPSDDRRIATASASAAAYAAASFYSWNTNTPPVGTIKQVSQPPGAALDENGI